MEDDGGAGFGGIKRRLSELEATGGMSFQEKGSAGGLCCCGHLALASGGS